ncbi:hypothetical protein X975_10976, partial [Stegodyphus mimosarum]
MTYCMNARQIVPHSCTNELSFRVYSYFKNNGSVFATQRLFRQHFNLGRHGKVPDGRTIVRWVSAFRTTDSVCDGKPGRSERTVRIPEAVENVLAAILRNPKRSARGHSQTLHMSDRSLRRILHEDLHFHPYKLQVV